MRYINLRHKLTAIIVSAAAAMSAVTLPQVVIAEEKQYFPIASSRVGPYSAMGQRLCVFQEMNSELDHATNIWV